MLLGVRQALQEGHHGLGKRSKEIMYPLTASY